MNNYPNTVMKVITFSVILISGAFGSAFAGDLKEICFIGSSAEDDCKKKGVSHCIVQNYCCYL